MTALTSDGEGAGAGATPSEPGGQADAPGSAGPADAGADPHTENPYGTTVPETDPTPQYESPLTRSGRGPYPDTERVTEPGDAAIGGMD
jgi:hypothetical protein